MDDGVFTGFIDHKDSVRETFRQNKWAFLVFRIWEEWIFNHKI